MIKLLEHAMKVIECVFERRIKEKVKIDAMQFGFMPGKGTTDAIFTAIIIIIIITRTISIVLSS